MFDGIDYGNGIGFHLVFIFLYFFKIFHLDDKGRFIGKKPDNAEPFKPLGNKLDIALDIDNIHHPDNTSHLGKIILVNVLAFDFFQIGKPQKAFPVPGGLGNSFFPSCLADHQGLNLGRHMGPARNGNKIQHFRFYNLLDQPAFGLFDFFFNYFRCNGIVVIGHGSPLQ